MFIDADLSTSIEELDSFLDALHNGNEMVFGCRLIDGYLPQQKVYWYRRVISAAFRIVRIAIIGSCSVEDTQCGFKVFRRDAAMKIFPLLRIERFAFDSELVFLAHKAGYQIIELPVGFRSKGKGSVNFLSDPIDMMIDLIRIRLNHMTGKYSVTHRGDR